MNKRILFVDDEPNILQALKRAVRKEYDVVTAEGPEPGLQAIADSQTFAVIVSDMRMPSMNGVEFLRAAKQLSPDSVRVMLTGNSDQQTAIDAVNGGEVFRFLTKPCDIDVLRSVLEQGTRHFQLLHAEQELLNDTLQGCITMMADLLSMLRPDAFGKTCRLRQKVIELLNRRDDLLVNDSWAIETGVLLSQLGSMTVQPDILTKMQRGELLEPSERRHYCELTSQAADMLQRIPRMQPVAEIVRYQHKQYNGAGYPDDTLKAEAIPLGARALYLVQVQDELRSQGYDDEDLRIELLRRRHEFDPRLLEALLQQPAPQAQESITQVKPGSLSAGMVFNQDVSNKAGSLLVCEGQRVTPAVIDHLQRFVDDGELTAMLEVLVPPGDDDKRTVND
ncbi:MAG: HD domain-containing phosphohydrolase [Pseudomonadota bacterium]